jgi:hypothetical protein
LIHWAEGVGSATAELVRTILERKASNNKRSVFFTA